MIEFLKNSIGVTEGVPGGHAPPLARDIFVTVELRTISSILRELFLYFQPCHILPRFWCSCVIRR